MTIVMGRLIPAGLPAAGPGPYAERMTFRWAHLLVHPDRPLLISVLFWADVTTLAGVHLLHPDAAVLGSLPLAAALTLAVLLWPALPWRRGTGHWRLPACFALVTVLVVMTDGTGASLFLVLIALTCLNLVGGTRAGVAGWVSMSVALGVGTVLIVHKSVGQAFYQAFGVLLFAAFVLALTTAVDRERRAREHAAGLVAELAEAHAELSRYAARVHGLAVAEERTRMARELHDTVGHHLTVIKLGLENAERYREHDPGAAWQDVRQAKKLTVDALQEVRRGVRAMRPPVLDGHRGSAALRELARSFDGTGVAVAIRVEGPERILDESRELVLYRVVQESLTNALRHSGGSEVVVRLGFTPEAVRLSVADDGRGVACVGPGGDSPGVAGPGFGLTSLAARVREAGGALRAGNRSGGGFQVLVDLPEPA